MKQFSAAQLAALVMDSTLFSD